MNAFLAYIFITLFWAIFAVGGYVVARYFKERLVIRCCVLLTAICCYLLWLVAFLMQLNPLIGPKVSQQILFGMATYWMNK